MINWLIIMFTEWLMLMYYFHSLSNINIGNPYNFFRLDSFLFFIVLTQGTKTTKEVNQFDNKLILRGYSIVNI